jgi:hypothetical protein
LSSILITFTSFGELLVPKPIWRALTHFNVWIEPALVVEWIRIIKDYMTSQGCPIVEETFYVARRGGRIRNATFGLARELALDLLKGDKLFCVWTGKKLKEDSLDIDHCFPWSSWPCGDLWNLLPSLRSVNQNQKSDHPPSAGRLAKARETIVGWWTTGYTHNVNELIGENGFGQRQWRLCPALFKPHPSKQSLTGWSSSDYGFTMTSNFPNGNRFASTSGSNGA